MAINNRYEFMFFIECVNGNPNGDPDMGNTPRMDPQDMHGYISDVAIKRRIRNYIEMAYSGIENMQIIIKNATNINKYIAYVNEKANVKATAKSKEKVNAARDLACQLFYDVRTFGAVLSTGLNAGQVRGPVQLTFARSLDPILPLDISITRMAITKDVDNVKTYDAYEKWESEQDEASLRTMGRKQFIPYGLYEARGFISANLAEETNFDEKDLRILFEAIMNMYEHDRSASKGQMSVISPLIIFKHVGTDSDSEQRVRQSKLGCAPAHKLFELVKVQRKENVEVPRSYKDYIATVNLDAVPNGVDIGFLCEANGEIVYNRIPEFCDWLKADV